MHNQSATLSINIDASLVKSFTPEGRLRASINVGNPILANLDSDGLPFGVSVDLAREFARQIGVELELKVFDRRKRRKAKVLLSIVRFDEE